MKTPLQLFLSAQTPEKILEMALDMACRLVDIEEVSFNEKEVTLTWSDCGIPVGNTFEETLRLDTMGLRHENYFG